MAQSQIEVLGNGVVIASGDTTPSMVDDTDFGVVNSGIGSVKRTIFTISNPGDVNLILTSNPRIIRASGSTTFTVTQQPNGTVQAGNTRTFEVTFDPFAFQNGILQTAVFSIANDNTGGDANPYTFTVSGTGQAIPDIVVLGSGNRIFDGDTTPRTADGTDFGSVVTASGTNINSFSVANDNPSNTLTLTGTPIVSITGANAADFTVTAQPPTTSITNNVAQFDVLFDPSVDGLRTATISIASDDPDENPYTFSIQGTGTSTHAPEIRLVGSNSLDIVSGDTTPATNDGTDYGSVELGSNVNTNFFILNSGAADLNLGTVNISGANAADFSVFGAPASTIAGGSQSTLQLRFTPSVAGVRTATISIPNNDPDENPYIFAVRGTGTAPAAPRVTSIVRVNGSPTSLDVLNWDITFDKNVINVDAADFSIAGTTANVSVTSSTASFYSVQISGGDLNTLNAVVSFAFAPGQDIAEVFGVPLSNTTPTGANENLYTLVNLPEIRLVGSNSLEIVDGDTTPATNDGTDFGSSVVGSEVNTSFFIANPGDATLNVGTVTISGTNAGDFTIVTQPASTIASPGSSTFQIRFNPSAAGVRTATITIPNNDADENPYTFAVQGTGTATDTTAPRVASITRQNPTTTNTSADSLTWRVTFDEPVQNVNGDPGSDFFITGVTGGTLTATAVSTSVYDVTITGGNLAGLNGTVNLTFNGGNLNITDFAGNALTNTGVTGTNDNFFGVSNVPAAPEINVTGLGVSIVDGDTTPSVADDTDFGGVVAVAGVVSHTFTIENTGTTLLTLGPNAVTKSGANQAEFVITTQPAATVAAGGTTTFTVAFDPFNVSVHTVTLSINNDDADENPYTFALQGTGTPTPEINLLGNGISIVDGDTTPSVADDTDFGSADIATGMVSHTFTVHNTGTATLNLGANAASLSGANAADFSVTTQPATMLPPAGTTTVVVQFDPSVLGARTATLTITNDDSDESPYTFAVQGTGTSTSAPEIVVVGASNNIADGDTSPTIADNTDFGSAHIVTGLITKIFGIQNTGSGTLTLGANAVSLTGVDAADFTVTNQPTTTVAAGANTSFTIRFDPATLGVKNATITLANDDADESPFSFSIRATGFGTPIMDVTGNGVVIGAGDTAPRISDHTDFGSTDFTAGTLSRTFTVRNAGSDVLTLGANAVTLTGVNAADFTVTGQPATSVATGIASSASIIVQLDPSALGLRTATLSIANDDPVAGKSPYTFAIQGTGTAAAAPEIRVEGAGSFEIVDGDTTPNTTDGTAFGSVAVGQSPSNSFIIINTGMADLTLGAVTITGSGDFSVTGAPSSPVTPPNPNFTTLQITYAPSSSGVAAATVSIPNNDSDENPYTFAVTGTGVAPEIDVAGNGTSIVSGDLVANTSDGTDFGSGIVGSNVSSTNFTISNQGNLALTIGTVTITGADPGDFTITTGPAGNVNPGTNTTLQITFNPSATGVRSATVIIPNNDADESVYSFTVSGTGTGTPEINVTGSGIDIVDGDTTPNTADDTDFGSIGVSSGTQVSTFTIENTGTDVLTLGANAATLSGADAADFLVVTQPATTIASGATSTVAVQFDPSASGVRNATLSIANDDSDEAPYNFAISGTGSLAPTAVLSGVPAQGNAAFTVTITFSESVTGFTLGEITVGNGTASNLAGSGAIYTALITPTNQGQVAIDVASGVAQSIAAGLDNTAAAQVVSSFDNLPPSVVISGVPVTSNSAFTATFTFSEDVNGFALADISVGNGVASGFSVTSASLYTATVTPSADGNVSIDVAAGVAQDGVANANTAAVQAVSAFDATSPSVVISGTPTTTSGAFTATITFSENVTGFAIGDVTVANATTSNFTGSGADFTVLVTPTNTSDITIDVAGGVAQDAATNDNIAATQVVVSVDNVAPSVSVSGLPANTNAAFTATFTFSESVTGFTQNGITLSNGTASNFAGSGTTYTVLLSPDGNGDMVVSIGTGVGADAAGNGNTALSAITIGVDIRAPRINSIARLAPATLQTANDSLTWRITFDEDVQNVDATDFSVTGTTATISVNAQSVRIYDVTITGGDLAELNATVTLSVAAQTDISDTLGNVMAELVSSGQNDNIFNVQNDVVAPTVTVSGVPAAIDGPFTITFTFSEDVTGFNISDILVTNGTASGFTSAPNPSSDKNATSQSASVFGALITPAGEGALTITVNAGAYADLAGNANTAITTVSTVVDTTSPTVALSGVPQSVRGPFELTITFNEDVSGFELAEIGLNNATGSDFTTISTRVYTALVTPLVQGEVTMSIAANVALDAAGNGNTAATPVTAEFIDETFVRDRTLRVINNFLVRRADQITLSDPDLSRRLLDGTTDGRLTGQAVRHNTQLAFNGKASGEDAKLQRFLGADVASRINMWTEASLAVVTTRNAKNNLILAYAGVDYRLSEDTLVGVMGQYDYAVEENENQNYDISGNGWMLGPYIVSRLTDSLVFDGRASWGQSQNKISPFRTYTDSFGTNRWLLKGQLTGQMEWNKWRVNPNVALIYFEEEQKAYTDTLGIAIPAQTVNLGRVTFGPRFSKTFQQSEDVTLVPSFSFKGIWDFEKAGIVNLDTGLVNSTGALRLRTEARLSANMAKGSRLSLKGFYDGIGATNFEAYGLTLGIDFPLK